MKAKKLKIYIKGSNTRSASFWTSFRTQLGKSTVTDDYIAVFTVTAKLRPAEYQFGERRVTL